MLISASGKYEEYVEEEVDDVQVDVERSEDVFLRTERVGVLPSHHQLCVVHQITGEDQSSGNSNPDHRPFAGGKEGEEEDGDDEDNQNSKQNASTHCEVNLGLEGEHCECQGDSGRDPHSDQHGVDIVVAGDGSQHEALAQGEDPEEDEVDGKLPPDVGAAGEGDDADQGDDQAGVVHPHALTTDIRFQRVNEEEAGNDGTSDEELHHENTVHLPHEVPSDGLVGEPFQDRVDIGGFRVVLASSGENRDRSRSRGGEMSRIWWRWLHLFVSHLSDMIRLLQLSPHSSLLFVSLTSHNEEINKVFCCLSDSEKPNRPRARWKAGQAGRQVVEQI